MSERDVPRVAGDYVGGDKVTQTGDRNIGIIKQAASERDLDSLMSFVEAVAQNLSRLPVDARSRQDAANRIADIHAEAAEARPSRQRLIALGKSLRAIVESTATNALTAYLTGLWKP